MYFPVNQTIDKDIGGTIFKDGNGVPAYWRIYSWTNNNGNSASDPLVIKSQPSSNTNSFNNGDTLEFEIIKVWDDPNEEGYEGSMVPSDNPITFDDGDPSNTLKFAVVSDIHIKNDSLASNYTNMCDYLKSENINFVACAGDLIEEDEGDMKFLKDAINYGKNQNIEFRSCYGNHDTGLMNDLYYKFKKSWNLDKIKDDFDSINNRSGLTQIKNNYGIFIFLSI